MFRVAWVWARRYVHVESSFKGRTRLKNRILYAVIILTRLHNHTISTSYKPMLAEAHSAPTPVAQSLNFRDRMAWFHKQSATTGSCAEDEVITEGGPQRETGHNVGHVCNERENDNHRAAPSQGLWGVHIVPVSRILENSGGGRRYYAHLSAKVRWMASMLSLEHSLFTLTNTTPKRIFTCNPPKNDKTPQQCFQL